MKRISDFIWPAVALAAMGFAFWLLFTDKELRTLSFHDVMAGIAAIPPHNVLMCVASTALAYFALAWYDRIGLMHLGHKLAWPFIVAVSFVTYALSHNLGFPMFSGAAVRYRAYSTKNLSPPDIAFMVGFCSFTFTMGVTLLGGIVLAIQPEIVERLFLLPSWIARVAGIVMLALVALYIVGSTFRFPPLVIGKYKVVYPELKIALFQLISAPTELLGAAGIIYFALPEQGNPGYFVVLGVFLASFSAGLLSHAPGGLGFLDVIFIKAMPDMPVAQVAAAVIMFRLFYLLIPLVISLVLVFLFEQSQLAAKLKREKAAAE